MWKIYRRGFIRIGNMTHGCLSAFAKMNRNNCVIEGFCSYSLFSNNPGIKNYVSSCKKEKKEDMLLSWG